MASSQTLPGTAPKLVLNLSKVKDPATLEALQAMLRLLQEMQKVISTVVNNNGEGKLWSEL